MQVSIVRSPANHSHTDLYNGGFSFSNHKTNKKKITNMFIFQVENLGERMHLNTTQKCAGPVKT